METNLPTPMTARVYVNLPEGSIYSGTFIWNILIWKNIWNIHMEHDIDSGTLINMNILIWNILFHNMELPGIGDF